MKRTLKMLGGIACAIGMLGANQALAEENGRSFGEIYTDCGLGAMIASDTEAVAAVTNVTWDLGTTAISSNATSPETCQGGKADTAALIHDVYPQIENDLARGNGEHLDALLALTGCDESVYAGLTTALRADLVVAVSSEDYEWWSREQYAATMHGRLHDHMESRFSHACA